MPSIRKTGSYKIKTQTSEKELDIRKDEVLISKSELWLKLADRVDIKEYKQIAECYAANTLAGKEVFMLPQCTEKLYTVTELANMLSVTPQKLGRVISQLQLRTDEYSKQFFDKSRYSNKEVVTYRYNEKAKKALEEYFA